MEHNAKNFAIQLGALISLYVSLTALIMLFLGTITIIYPDEVNAYWEYESAASNIRVAIAMLIVFFPTYVSLTKLVNRARRVHDGSYLSLTRWLMYLSLLIGGGVLLGDLVMIINTFLNGELTVRFILKACVFLAVVGSAFTYYIFDVHGYWQAHERDSQKYGIMASIFVIASIIFGYTNMEGPAEVREMRLDDKQVQDLIIIQSQIEVYYYTNKTLPTNLEATFVGIEVPHAPKTRTPYTYDVVDESTYKLCAQFYTSSKLGEEYINYSTPLDSLSRPITWEHGSGDWCYTRVITDTSILK